MHQAELFPPNYIVIIDDWNGHREIPCNTVDETWRAVGQRTIGGLYRVHSPVGLDTREFVPY